MNSFYYLKYKLKQHRFLYSFLLFVKNLCLLPFRALYLLACLTRNLFTHDIIFTRGWIMRQTFGVVRPFNWGDELNKFFIEFITGMKVVCMKYDFPIRHYSMIGSILGWYSLDKTIVYGSGIIEEAISVSGRPDKIISVRGPLTRYALIQKGYECPKRYGDPALLLPVFYSPKRRPRKYILLISHWKTLQYNTNSAPLIELQGS